MARDGQRRSSNAANMRNPYTHSNVGFLCDMVKTWKDRIDQAVIRGGFTPDDSIDAEDWRCCAVGETLNLNDDDYNNDTISDWLAFDDSTGLFEAGREFYQAVERDDFDKAKRVLQEIKNLEGTVEVPSPLEMEAIVHHHMDTE